MTCIPFDRLPDVMLFSHYHEESNRGAVAFSWDPRELFEETGVNGFAESCAIISNRGALRGLHYNVKLPIGRMFRTVIGRTFNVVVDVRADSPSFGEACSVLMDSPATSLWVPPGYAAGFYAFDANTVVVQDFFGRWKPGGDCVLQWNDHSFDIDWPPAAYAGADASERDSRAPTLKEIERVPKSVWGYQD